MERRSSEVKQSWATAEDHAHKRECTTALTHKSSANVNRVRLRTQTGRTSGENGTDPSGLKRWRNRGVDRRTVVIVTRDSAPQTGTDSKKKVCQPQEGRTRTEAQRFSEPRDFRGRGSSNVCALSSSLVHAGVTAADRVEHTGKATFPASLGGSILEKNVSFAIKILKCEIITK